MRRLTLPILILAVAAALLLVGLGSCSADGDLEEPAVVGLSSPAEEAATSAPSEAPVPAEPQARRAEPPRSAGRPAPAAPPAAAGERSERALVEAVKNWVAAWSERRVEDYLDSYSRSFVPEGGISRRVWEAQRRERISSARFVRVAITGLETELRDGGARATFLQYYRSDGYSDTVRKTLDLVWEDGRWRIARERSADER